MRRNDWLRRMSALLMAFMLTISGYALPSRAAEAAERTEAQYVFTDYEHGYHLVSFLDGYNVLAFGNAYSELHMMGAILVQGTYSGGWSNSGFADGENLPPSYVKGMILAPNSVYNSRNHSNVAPLYVGSGNEVESWESNGTTYYSVNGLRTGNNSTTPVYVSNDFFSFEEAYAVIKADQATMVARGTVVRPDENNIITVQAGDNVIIESLEGVTSINIIGDPTSRMNTTINIMDSGDVKVPMELFDGSQPAVREQNEAGTAVVFNFPNADSVELPTQNWVGHVIAPDADVTQYSGNFNGCIICEDLYTGAEGHVYNYNTTDTSWDTVFSLEKVWNDGNDAEGRRPSYIEVQLLANGQPYGSKVRMTPDASGAWYHVWNSLPETDDSGRKIDYTVAEVNVPDGYTSEYVDSTQTLINTYEYEEIDIRGTKTWAGEGAFGSRMRPPYLTVYLYANGEEVAKQTITVDSNPTQSYVFENLPKYKDGKEIRYTVHEDTVPNYIGETDGYNLINTWGGETVEIHGVKTWNDDNNRDGLRPDSITIQLLADGTVIEEHISSASSGWAWHFTNLPKNNADGSEIIYTIREKTVPSGYTTQVSGYDVINTHEIETIDLSGRKTWDDDGNNDGLRPASITVILLADQAEVSRQVVTAANGWSWSFEDMPRYYGGKEIRYTVTELPVEGYTAHPSGMNMTNTHVNETVEVSGSKTWADNDDNDGLRPASITIRLLQDGTQYAVRTVTEADGWAWSFTDLPKYTGGKEHVYTITEDAVSGYTAAVSGYDVTNTHVGETVDISGVKTWADNDNQDGLRPYSIWIRLWDGATEVAAHEVDANDNWAWSFTNLPKYDNGREIVYTITEDAVPGYTTTVSGYNVTNTHTTETIDVSGAKTWDDNDNNDGKRPSSITIRLWNGDTEIASKSVTAADGWAWSFTDLPRYENGGHEIVYTISEDAVHEYSTVISGYDVINSYDTEYTQVTGYKTWDDDENNDGKRPASIVINLLADGVEIDQKTVTAADNWQGSFTGLPKYKDGREIVYTITEDPVTDYTTVIHGFNVVNSYETEHFTMSGSKTWNDNGDQDGMRPDSITIRLLANGVEIAHQVIDEEDNWAWVFQLLPKYANGVEIVYTITEDPVPGYTTDITGDATRYTVTNTHETETTSVSGSKTWDDAENQDGKRPASIVINLLANGVEVDQKTVTAANGWMWSFTDLPKYANGEEIVYTITEDSVADYTTVVDGYNVTNSYETETTSVSGSKTWDDAENQDGKRPASIVINLLADGVEVDQKTVTAANGWMWSFTDLPKYANGEEIVYTITEDAVADYTTVVDGYNVTNSYETETTSVSGSKIWFDADDVHGDRPDSITIHLLADGVKVASRKVTEADEWSWTFTELPKYSGSRLIKYTIEEEPVEKYDTVIDGYDVINAYFGTTFRVTKEWQGEHGGQITLTLYADGVKLNPQPPVTRMGDVYLWENLPLCNPDGSEIVYYAMEKFMDGYMTIYDNAAPYAHVSDRVYDGGTIINRQTTDVFVRKVWTGLSEGETPPEIELILYCNGKPVDYPQPAPDQYGWYKYYNLPATVNGAPAVYTVREASMAGYFATYTNTNGEQGAAYDDGVITNHKVPATGDETPLLLLTAMLAVSVAGLGLMVLQRRRHA
ncbi:MAG: Cna B-type domain-containing protein [Clostridia bacterium]|nr:Cna B-type domain-containing protein [Clostridia bacterium]